MGKKDRIGMSRCISKTRIFLSVHVDDNKIVGRKQNLAPMWKKLMKLVDLDEPTLFLDHVYLACTQCECKPYEDIVNQFGDLFESRISATATEKLQDWRESRDYTALETMVVRYFEMKNREKHFFS